MKVQDAARKFNVSTTTIYNHLKKLENGGKTGKKGEISQDGIRILEAEFSNFNQVESTLKEDLKQQIEDLQEQLSAAEQRVKSLQMQLQSAEQRAAAQQQANEILSVRLQAAEQRAEDLKASGEQRAKDLQAQIALYESRVIPLLPVPENQEKDPGKVYSGKERWRIFFTGHESKKK